MVEKDQWIMENGQSTIVNGVAATEAHANNHAATFPLLSEEGERGWWEKNSELRIQNSNAPTTPQLYLPSCLVPGLIIHYPWIMPARHHWRRRRAGITDNSKVRLRRTFA